MIVKIQTPAGWEFHDKAKTVRTGVVTPDDTRIVRWINCDPLNDDATPKDYLPHVSFEVVYDDGDVSGPIATNGEVFLLNDTGRTIDRL